LIEQCQTGLSLGMLPRKVPWTPDEVDGVFELLFSTGEPEDQRKGLRRVRETGSDKGLRVVQS
jgi:hypothetical protein